MRYLTKHHIAFVARAETEGREAPLQRPLNLFQKHKVVFCLISVDSRVTKAKWKRPQSTTDDKGKKQTVACYRFPSDGPCLLGFPSIAHMLYPYLIPLTTLPPPPQCGLVANEIAFAISYFVPTILIQRAGTRKDPAVTSFSYFARFWKALRRLLNQNHPKPDASLSLPFFSPSLLSFPAPGQEICFALLCLFADRASHLPGNLVRSRASIGILCVLGSVCGCLVVAFFFPQESLGFSNLGNGPVLARARLLPCPVLQCY